MKKSAVVLLHAGYWLLYCALFTFMFFVTKASSREALDNWDDWLITIIPTTLSGLITFYCCYFLLVPKYVFRKKIRLFAVAGISLCIGVGLFSAIISILLLKLIIAIFSGNIDSQQFFVAMVPVVLKLTLFFSLLNVINGVVAMVIRGFINWYADIHVKETLLNKNLRTELALLKAQINPHFLFNTLNNIDVLIEKDAQKASAYLNKLSEILRFVLYDAQSELIPLAKELEYIRKYVDLQKIRTANEDYVCLEIEGDPGALEIAPMVFIPYIENAFKYATNKKVSNAIRIRISIDDLHIHLYCENAIDKSETGILMQGGLGNNLLKNRLDLLYASDYQLHVENLGDKYTVNLALPLKIHELSHY
jgi:two-component system, LytTR family, sensor kinase